MSLHKKNCGNCLRGTKINVNQDVLCVLNGAVSYDYVCSKHRFSPVSSKANKQSLKCSDCCHFIHISHEENGDEIGYCHMFTVRHYNGSLKKVCSKFSKKDQREVS
jgi:hypothetical protein